MAEQPQEPPAGDTGTSQRQMRINQHVWKTNRKATQTLGDTENKCWVLPLGTVHSQGGGGDGQGAKWARAVLQPESCRTRCRAVLLFQPINGCSAKPASCTSNPSLPTHGAPGCDSSLLGTAPLAQPPPAQRGCARLSQPLLLSSGGKRSS